MAPVEADGSSFAGLPTSFCWSRFQNAINSSIISSLLPSRNRQALLHLPRPPAGKVLLLSKNKASEIISGVEECWQNLVAKCSKLFFALNSKRLNFPPKKKNSAQMVSTLSSGGIPCLARWHSCMVRSINLWMPVRLLGGSSQLVSG